MEDAPSFQPECGAAGRPWQRRRQPGSRVWGWLLICLAVVGVADLLGITSAPQAGAQDPVGQESGPTGGDVDATSGADGTPGLTDSVLSEEGDPVAGHTDDEHADGGHGGHTDPAAAVLLAIIIVLFFAKLGGDLFERMNMPAVLGELVVGVIIGNMSLMTGWHGLDFLKAPDDARLQAAISKLEHHEESELTAAERRLIDDTHSQTFYNAGAILKMLASIGVVLLLFEVGLESSVREMMSVGASSMVVAIVGVVTPMILGYAVGWLLLRDSGWQVHAFIGATLTATSVGITARVLKDLGRSQQRESQIILGAAVIDDVLGLIVLAIVSGIILQGENFSPASLSGIVLKSFGFLAGAIVLGTFLFNRPLFRAASYLRGHGLLVVTSLVICFGFSWLASQMGLATIVGAFAAGLILERAHYRELGQKENVRLEEALMPLTAVLVPIFFVQMGIMVDLSSFADPSVWGLATGLTLVAILGKQVCALGVLEKGLNRLAVGLGMIPRGEVGLIFAAEGAKLQVAGEPVINAGTYSAVVVMVMVTTMVTPPVLKWALMRGSQATAPDPSTGMSSGDSEA